MKHRMTIVEQLRGKFRKIIICEIFQRKFRKEIDGVWPRAKYNDKNKRREACVPESLLDVLLIIFFE